MNYTNKLALVLLTTAKEYYSGAVDSCLEKYLESKPSKDKKIDLFIFFNQGQESEYSKLLKLKSHKNINDVIIKSHKLSFLDDIYVRSPCEFKKFKDIPRLGGSSGANNLFFKSMISLCERYYDDFLMIETDTQPVKNYWIDKILDFCVYNDFLIAGSTYKGPSKLPTFQAWTGHLNGVAIYKCDPLLKLLLQYTEKLIESEISQKTTNFLSFDCAIHQLCCSLCGKKYFASKVIDTNIISNYSLPSDKKTSIKSVLKQHPQTIILHKK
jgi:hypothetical protein